MTAISVRDLVKSYGPVQAVRGISFDVEDGMFFAFLGVNGAGKSTTINCLTTLLKPNGGQAEVAGFRLGEQDDEIRRSIGVVFQPALLDPLLTVRENLALRALFHGMGKEEFAERVEQLTDLLGLGEFIDRRYGRLSGGQRRRSDIARGMLHTPQILFLDEPTAGLDPHSREQVWEAIMDVRELQGMTVFLTTHYMAETERADRVCIINAGEIVAEGTPEQLRARYSSSELKLHLSDEAWSRSELRQIGVDLPRSDGPGEPVTIQVASSAEAQDILATVWNAVDDFEFRHGSMDDVFLNLTSTNDDGATAQPRERADALDRTGEERRDDERAWGREASEPAWEREPLDDPRSWNQGEDHRRPQERWDASGAEDRIARGAVSAVEIPAGPGREGATARAASAHTSSQRSARPGFDAGASSARPGAEPVVRDARSGAEARPAAGAPTTPARAVAKPSSRVAESALRTARPAEEAPAEPVADKPWLTGRRPSTGQTPAPYTPSGGVRPEGGRGTSGTGEPRGYRPTGNDRSGSSRAPWEDRSAARDRSTGSDLGRDRASAYDRSTDYDRGTPRPSTTHGQNPDRDPGGDRRPSTGRETPYGYGDDRSRGDHRDESRSRDRVDRDLAGSRDPGRGRDRVPASSDGDDRSRARWDATPGSGGARSSAQAADRSRSSSQRPAFDDSSSTRPWNGFSDSGVRPSASDGWRPSGGYPVGEERGRSGSVDPTSASSSRPRPAGESGSRPSSGSGQSEVYGAASSRTRRPARDPRPETGETYAASSYSDSPETYSADSYTASIPRPGETTRPYGENTRRDSRR